MPLSRAVDHPHPALGQQVPAGPVRRQPVRETAVHAGDREPCLGTLELGRALLSDEMPTVQAGPGQCPTEDLVGDDLAGRYRRGAVLLVAATTADSVGRIHITPLGEMPGAMLAGFTGLDVLVHGWDLACSIGRDTDLDPALTEPVLAFARQAIGDDMSGRAAGIGPIVPVAVDADPTARLVAYLGRTP